MSASTVPPQEHFFYDSFFTCGMDHSLLHSIITQKFTNEWSSNEIPEEAWKEARLAVNETYQSNILWEDVVQRKHFLLQRYKTFKELCQHKFVQYDPSSNFVFAADDVWSKLFKKNWLYQAYRHADEPEYTSLSVIFGIDDVKTEISNTVINISSSMSLPPHGAKTIILSEDDEVNSLVFKTTRHKLFTANNVEDSDHVSTTDVDTRFAYVHPNPRSKGFPAKKKGTGSSSSCTSNSPVERYCFGPFKK